MSGKQIEVSIERYLEALRTKNIKVKKAILYGSHALGTNDRDSDIDLAIISPEKSFKKGKPFLKNNI